MIPFSRRTDWDSSENQLSVLLASVKASGQSWFNLTESNPTRCGFVYPDAIVSALSDPDVLKYQPESKGILAARAAVREYYRQRGYDVPVEHIILTSSTSEAYSFLFRLLADPGDAVLFPRPSYPLFQFLADLNDAPLKFYDLFYDQNQWHIDANSLQEAIGEETKAIITVNPNNPTGSFVKSEELAVLADICRQNDLALISDEVFCDYPLGAHRGQSLVGHDRCLTFVMNGLSKILGLPQMKLSWIVVNGPADDVARAVKRLEVIADTYLSVNTPVQRAWPIWLECLDDVQGQISRRIRENYAWLQQRCGAQQNVRCLNAEGGWYAMVALPDKLSEEEWTLKFLKDAFVYVHPGYFFDADQETCMVVSLLPAPEVFQGGVERMMKTIQVISR